MSIQQTKNVIDPYLEKEPENVKGASPKAPKWVKDAIIERSNKGESLETTIGKLSRSPFWKDQWVIL
jgi:hypothetical protein